MTIRQHTVPRTYLHGFTDPKGRLRAFDRVNQKAITMSVNDATVVNHIYDLPASPDGLDFQPIEDFLGQKESAIAGVLKEIRAGHSAIESAHQKSLAEFIALQMMRTTRTDEQVNQLGDWYGKLWVQGISREDVKERYRKEGIEPKEEQVEHVMEFVNNPGKYRFVPPNGSFLFFFLGGYFEILPHLVDGWNWIVVRSKRPFLTSDHPVIMIGDSVDGGLGVANAEEIWLPVGRHHSIVLTKDYSLPKVVLEIPPLHAKRICQRIALESTRWLLWHPKDNSLDGIDTPTPGPRLRIETLGWRERGDGTIGELVRFGSNRPVIAGESLLNGRLVRDSHGVPNPPWKPGKPHFPVSDS